MRARALVPALVGAVALAAAPAHAVLVEMVTAGITSARDDLVALLLLLTGVGAVVWGVRHIRKIFAFPKHLP